MTRKTVTLPENRSKVESCLKIDRIEYMSRTNRIAMEIVRTLVQSDPDHRRILTERTIILQAEIEERMIDGLLETQALHDLGIGMARIIGAGIAIGSLERIEIGIMGGADVILSLPKGCLGSRCLEQWY